jgi:hypothetical protein
VEWRRPLEFRGIKLSFLKSLVKKFIYKTSLEIIPLHCINEQARVPLLWYLPAAWYPDLSP